MTNNPCVLIGVTGGIAAYKICSLVSSLHKQGYEVHVLMTKEAQEFITPLTMQSLSGQKVILDMFTIDYTPDVHHISLAQKADAFVIAPATANVIAKIANGIADDMLHILESGSGYLACGTTGKGRMPEPDQIEDALKEILHTEKYLTGKKVLITAGPTCEAIDPVRYITNHSSGKMGYALARAARNAGADVTLVAGKTALADIRGVHMVPVTSAKDMAEAVLPRQSL